MQSVRFQGWVLWSIGGLAAIAALFAPSERWAGLDLGAVGASVFVLALGLTVWMFATRASSIFPDELSVGERSAWVSVAFLSLILLSFLRHFWALAVSAEPIDVRDPLPNAFTTRTAVLVAGWWWISRLIARDAGGVELDERDLRLLDRAGRVSDLAFMLTIITGIVLLVVVPAHLLTFWLAPVILANLLVGLLMFRSLLEQMALAIAYRMARG